MSAGKAPAPKLERVGKCGGVGSWSPGPGRKRVLTHCRCQAFSRSVTLSTNPAYPTCICGHSKGTHASVEVPA